MRHRPELDGLRGIAILGVLLVHAGIAPGGAFGVTVFFVLSGYLITSLITAEQDRTGTVRLPAFYRRRFARLLPALLLALVAVVVLARPTGQVWLTVLLAGTYVMNFAIPLFGFDQFATAGWSWSLALEEQFYLLWPFVLRRIRDRQRAALTLLVVAMAVALVRSWLWTRNPLAAVYCPDRADALLIGCALALAGARFAAWQGWVALGALLAAYKLGTVGGVNSVTLGLTLVAVSSAVVIGASHRPSLRLLLSSPVLTHLGAISYSLYLWNSLLLGVAGWRGLPIGDGRFVLVWLACSLAAAEVSTWLVERPLRRRLAVRHARPRAVAAMAPAA